MIEGSYTIYAKELIDKGFTPEVIIEELKKSENKLALT